MHSKRRRKYSLGAAVFGLALLACGSAMSQVCEEPLVPSPEPEKPATSMIGGAAAVPALQP